MLISYSFVFGKSMSVSHLGYSLEMTNTEGVCCFPLGLCFSFLILSMNAEFGAVQQKQTRVVQNVSFEMSVLEASQGTLLLMILLLGTLWRFWPSALICSGKNMIYLV